MATVYILYSPSLDKYYVGSCDDLSERIQQHLAQYFPGAFTSNANDWLVYLYMENLAYKQARKTEAHIKKMKSRKYIENLKKYPELLSKLTGLYQE